jgi:membrane-bound ClpP family serine protease
MTALGIVLLILGVVLVVAEAHVPGGILGMAGAVALIVGAIAVIAAAGGGAVLAVPVGAGLGVSAAAWALLVTRKTARAQRARIRSGSEALSGQVGVVRRWSAADGQVFVAGALWRAHHDCADVDGGALNEGEPVVVERVSGLTLSVRRAEEWELIA